jgi:hypothetical protein
LLDGSLRTWDIFGIETLKSMRTAMAPNYFLEASRLPLLRSVPGDRSDGLSTLRLPFFTGGRSGKR